MPIAAVSLALAGALSVAQTCRWDRPGANRFTGDTVAAVDHYADLTPDVRKRLKARMAAHQYDDRVVITREAITGRSTYAPEITGMHFGQNRVCRQVTRKKWSPRMKVEALVYCEGEHCLIVPAVCGNVSRIRRPGGDEPLDIEPAAGPAGSPAGMGEQALPAGLAPMGQLGAGPGAPPTATVRDDELAYEPPGAGPQTPGVPTGTTPPTSPPVVPVYPGGPSFPPPIVVIPGIPASPPPPVTMPAIPEPPTWVQWLVGLPIVGLALRHARRRESRAAARKGDEVTPP